MTVQLNEAALQALLGSREGPLGQFVERQAQQVVDNAKTNARIIMHRFPPAAEAIDVAITEDLRAIIGIKDEGSMSRYLAAKAAKPGETWFISALQGFGS